jgi:two-component system NtrC family sensor kinase
MQSQILQSRNTLRALFDNLQDEMYIVDRQYNVLAVNQAMSARVGSGPQTLVGRCCYRAIYGEASPCPSCLASAVFLSGAAQTQIIRRLAERGPEDVESSAYPVSSPEGAVTSAIVMNRDVTERRRIEATLFESAKLSAVGQLAASMAHEISNPLTVITGNVQYLLTEVGPDHPHFELLQLSERAARRANRVIRTLLDFSRQEAYEFVPTNLNTCIEDALSLVSYQLSRANITVVRQFGADLPSVVASASHLQTVWTNLLLNARDAMPRPTGGEIRIVTVLEQGGDMVRVDLTDTGQGIAPDHLSHIFEPFFTTKPVGKGTGLGLHVVHTIVERHVGRVAVSSHLGAGTTFSVWLPVSGAQSRGQEGVS